MVADRTEVGSRPRSRTAGHGEGGPSGRGGGWAERQTGSKQGLDTVAQRGLSRLHLGAGVGGASGQRKPEEVGAQTGLQALQRETGL